MTRVPVVHRSAIALAVESETSKTVSHEAKSVLHGRLITCEQKKLEVELNGSFVQGTENTSATGTDALRDRPIDLIRPLYVMNSVAQKSPGLRR